MGCLMEGVYIDEKAVRKAVELIKGLGESQEQREARMRRIVEMKKSDMGYRLISRALFGSDKHKNLVMRCWHAYLQFLTEPTLGPDAELERLRRERAEEEHKKFLKDKVEHCEDLKALERKRILLLKLENEGDRLILNTIVKTKVRERFAYFLMRHAPKWETPKDLIRCSPQMLKQLGCDAHHVRDEIEELYDGAKPWKEALRELIEVKLDEALRGHGY